MRIAIVALFGVFIHSATLLAGNITPAKKASTQFDIEMGSDEGFASDAEIVSVEIPRVARAEGRIRVKKLKHSLTITPLYPGTAYIRIGFKANGPRPGAIELKTYQINVFGEPPAPPCPPIITPICPPPCPNMNKCYQPKCLLFRIRG